MAPPFKFTDFLKVFGLSIILFAGFAALFAYVPQASDALAGFHPTVSFLVQYLIQFVVLFFPLWLFVVDKYNVGLTEFGFVKVRPWQLIRTVLLCYSFYLIISFALSAFLQYTGLSLPGYQEQASYLPLFGYDAVGLTCAFIVVAIRPC
jgi:hypothetical protein